MWGLTSNEMMLRKVSQSELPKLVFTFDAVYLLPHLPKLCFATVWPQL
jgi:hypothetical protein